jgi:hypothetical protein
MKLRFLSAIGIVCLGAACGDGETSSGGNSGDTGAGGTTGSTTSSGAAGSGGNGGSSQGSGGAGGGPSACAPALPTFADGKKPTGTLYVTAGAPAGGDGSQAKPFGALSDALKVVTPGIEVRVSGELTGLTYTSGVKGTEAAPIWITGEPGAKIGPLTLESASYVIAQDLELSQSDSHVLHFFFADHLLFRRLKIHDAGLGCIKGSQTSFAYVEDSELWAAGKQSGHPIIDFVGVNTGHIIRSSFHEGPGVMIMLKGGTSDMLFAWNEVYNQTSPGNALALGQSTGPMYFQPIDSAFEGLRIIAFGNLLHDLVGAPVAFEGCKDCAALHNTLWKTTGAQLVRFLPGAAGEASGVSESKPEGCRFAGNIVVGGQENGASLNADPQNHGPGNVVDYNVFLKPGSLNWWGDIPQDMVHSTYDKDPQLSAEGVPAAIELVDGKGPPDIGALPFADAFVRDAKGACLSLPADIGAIAVP